MNEDDKSFIYLIGCMLAGMTVTAVLFIWATMDCVAR